MDKVQRAKSPKRNRKKAKNWEGTADSAQPRSWHKKKKKHRKVKNPNEVKPNKASLLREQRLTTPIQDESRTPSEELPPILKVLPAPKKKKSKKGDVISDKLIAKFCSPSRFSLRETEYFTPSAEDYDTPVSPVTTPKTSIIIYKTPKTLDNWTQCVQFQDECVQTDFEDDSPRDLTKQTSLTDVNMVLTSTSVTPDHTDLDDELDEASENTEERILAMAGDSFRKAVSEWLGDSDSDNSTVTEGDHVDDHGDDDDAEEEVGEEYDDDDEETEEEDEELEDDSIKDNDEVAVESEKDNIEDISVVGGVSNHQDTSEEGISVVKSDTIDYQEYEKVNDLDLLVPSDLGITHRDTSVQVDPAEEESVITEDLIEYRKKCKEELEELSAKLRAFKNECKAELRRDRRGSCHGEEISSADASIEMQEKRLSKLLEQIEQEQELLEKKNSLLELEENLTGKEEELHEKEDNLMSQEKEIDDIEGFLQRRYHLAKKKEEEIQELEQMIRKVKLDQEAEADKIDCQAKDEKVSIKKSVAVKNWDIIQQSLIENQSSLQTQLYQAKAELSKSESRENDKARILQALNEQISNLEHDQRKKDKRIKDLEQHLAMQVELSLRDRECASLSSISPLPIASTRAPSLYTGQNSFNLRAGLPSVSEAVNGQKKRRRDPSRTSMTQLSDGVIVATPSRINRNSDFCSSGNPQMDADGQSKTCAVM
ncbi:hypothetical protein CAPTEDRAFT_222485 [Capitella teleta]|uniref:Uncharacterized protein n=1 Tax=Capitella teleta TaxID=283909 RepID=R7TS26_CAPTE|nr:hypothetical protein CAPTEDRAFT_222485 [Capitella teleta]|eukprot:ELT96728.1 hypothetical protein CAPTEDRAFT_222485 [Capitella teleta]